jgi:hypothetical protein
VIVIRYADDTVLGFQHPAEADRFLQICGNGWGNLDWNSIPLDTPTAGASSLS